LGWVLRTFLKLTVTEEWFFSQSMPESKQLILLIVKMVFEHCIFHKGKLCKLDIFKELASYFDYHFTSRMPQSLVLKKWPLRVLLLSMKITHPSLYETVLIYLMMVRSCSVYICPNILIFPSVIINICIKINQE
jgi:hypothetical protein